MFAFDEPFGSSIFCDDVRAEMGGKFSYMGVYVGGLSVPSFPATVPKFAIGIFFQEPLEMARKRDWPISLKVFMPGDATDAPTWTAAVAYVPKEVLQSIERSPLPDEEDVPKLVTVALTFAAAPLVFQRAGRIRVRAYYRDDIIKLGSLRVELAQPPSSGNPTASPPPS